ncbi:MAG TPA: 30S ribosomal protein S9 [Candidatus Eisenbacteria bacterium]|nr:30S ribosomal protein S9 [Candidatus Eisenbacteria bacterium]
MTVSTQPGTTGRRKEAVARVRLVVGTGRHLVNDRPIADYLTRDSLVRQALHALNVTQTMEKFDMLARVRGGGLTGQAGALRMAIARALAREDQSLRPQLSREGLLTRDARMKERKKYGQPGARKRFQFSKR